MSKWPMRGHFRYLSFKTFSTTPRTPQCKVFWALLWSSKHSGVPEDSKSPTFPSVGLHPHTWPKWGCDTNARRTGNWRRCRVKGIRSISEGVMFSRGMNIRWPFVRPVADKKITYMSNPCRNPTLAKCGGEAQHLEKLGIWSPPGLSNVQSSTSRGKTPRIGLFLVLMERS
jgi:hypothetical protein